jgi:serine/threonine protein kinase
VDQASPSVPDHEMIRPIGRGAYGEVWLARNIVGTYRAAKIVYRERFKDEAPYEREFNAIQKYEPLSRAEAGLVNILQIGRRDWEGYFYYVMELADDAWAKADPSPWPLRGKSGTSGSSFAQQAVDPQAYVPKTLSWVLKERERLSVGECLSLGLALTRSIGFLHENKLLHRDIKPSNIVFIRGAPKLADIGLLTDVSEARSLVGTDGYIAPEGPNSPAGDVFSLGKVLYEASTGKNRHQFPEPISNVAELPDANQFFELNAVIVRACEHDFKDRYASMDAMRADLELIPKLLT